MIPLTRPTLPPLKSLQDKMRCVFKSGMLTNSRFVAEFEKRCAKFLCEDYVYAVSNGTSALMLAAKCLNLKGEVILPSFTYTSTGHCLLWNNLKPVFVDVDPETFNLNPVLIEEKITKNTSAIFATHAFGNPCDIDAISKIAKKHNLKVVYDAAHAFGATYKGKSVAHYGDVVIFSLSPTKIVTTCEGGLVVVHNKMLYNMMCIGRNNGDSPNKEEEFLGITARMNEISAIIGIESLKILKQTIQRTKKLVYLYHDELSGINGIMFQKLIPNANSSYKAMTIVVDERKFGISRDTLLKELARRDIFAKVYFNPLHRKKVYSRYKHAHLPCTDFLRKNIISLPLYSHMPEQEVREVCSVIRTLAKK